MRYRIASLVALVAASAVLSSAQMPAHLEAAATGTSRAEYGRLPLTFEPNRGQADPRVQFLSRGGGYTLYLTATSAVLQLPGSEARRAERGPAAQGPPRALWLTLLHSNAAPGVSGVDLQPGRSNYYLGNDPRGWRTGIPNFGRVRFAQVYPGIDLLYYGRQRRLEYDFVLQPGADPRAIAWKIRGADQISVAADGSLRLREPDGVLHLERPVAYQERQGVRQEVAARYVLGRGHRVSFQVGAYDRSRTLIIDPVLVYATYFSRNDETQLTSIAADASGNAYLTGTTTDPSFPTVNAIQSTYGGGGQTDMFITKLDPTGATLVYSTYLGGASGDFGKAITVGADGSAYIAGGGGTDFPTSTGAFSTTCAAACPVAVKVNPDGTLGYSTFLGPSAAAATAITVDASGDAYIAGSVSSNDLPVVNAFQSSFEGTPLSSEDAFIEELGPAGATLLYSTYFGGGGGISGGGTGATGIALDAGGNIYLTGTTTTPIPLLNPVQSSVIGGSMVFLSKFVPDGSALVYSTLLGGVDHNQGGFVGVDASGSASVVGVTESPDFPLTPNALKTVCDVGSSLTCNPPQMFVTKFDPSGGSLLYSTFVAPTFFGGPFGAAFDASGHVFVVGGGVSPDFPTVNPVQGTLQTSRAGDQADAFVTELGTDGLPVFSTFLGGAIDSDQASAVAVNNGVIYVGGVTAPNLNLVPDFPVVSPFQSSPPCCGIGAEFIAQIAPGTTPILSLAPWQSPDLTVRNVGAAALHITNIQASSKFAAPISNCPAALAAGDSCFLRLEALKDGTTSGTVTLTSDAPGSPQTFTIQAPALGDPSGPELAYSRGFLRFPTILLGNSSPAKQLVITNVGSQASSIQGISVVTGDFSQTNDCPISLAPMTSCAVSVTYTPTATGFGTGTGQLRILHDAGPVSDTIFLGGTGSSNALLASPPSINFGQQYTVATLLPRLVTLTNVSSSALSVTGVTPSQFFSQTNNCTAPLPPQGSCQASVTFIPTTNQNTSGTLTVTHNGTGGSQTVSLNGQGRILSDLAASPLFLNFGATVLGSSFSQTVTLTNLSASALTLGSFTFSVTPDWTDTNDCPVSPATLAAGASCTVNISFAPSVVGDRSGTLSLFHSGTGSPQIIQLTGSGRTALTVSPSQLTFSDQGILSTGLALPVNVTNNTATPVNISSITVTPPFVIQQNPCPSTLNAFFGCVVTVAFSPTVAGPASGTLSVVASDSPDAHVVQLSGNGVFTPPGMGMSLNQNSLTAYVANLPATGGGSVSSFGGYNSLVDLSCTPGSTLPPTTCVLSPSPLTPASTVNGTTFTLTASGAPGVYNFNVQAVGEDPNHITLAIPLTLHVLDFSLSASPGAVDVQPTARGKVTLTVTAAGAFNDTLNLACGSPLPTGVSCSFSQNNFVPSTAGTPITVSIQATSAAPVGSTTVHLNVTGSLPGAPTKTVSFTLNIVPPPPALNFVPVTPCRVADTRNPAGPFGGPALSGGSSREFDIPNSACGIPNTAVAYSVNLTVVPHGPLGFLTAYPCGQSLPLASNLNSIDGRVKAVAAIVPAGTPNQSLCTYASDTTDLVIDIDGYFDANSDPSGLAFFPVTPCRVVDTRLAAGPLGGPSMPANTTRDFPIQASACGIPGTAQAYSLNYTVVPKGPLGFLTTWPTGQARPLVSTLNAVTGTVVANAAMVPASTSLSTAGDVSVFVTDATDVIIDINGYFAPPGTGGLSFHALSPCRVLDTRNPSGTPPFTGTLSLDVVASGCGAPSAARAYVLNTTVVPPGPLGFLTLWPQGTTQPLVSTLNAIDGAVTSNLAIVPTSNTSISSYASNPTHLILDMSGYFSPQVGDYTLVISDSPQTVYSTQSAIFHGTATAINNYNSSVNLSCASGSTPAPFICAAGAVTPTAAGTAFTVGNSGFPTDYVFNLHGVGTDANTTIHDVPVTLHVIGYTITLPTPGTVIAPLGSSGTATFTVTALGTFTDTVTLSCGGLPAEVSCSFSPNDFTPSNAGTVVTMTVSSTLAAVTGAYSVGVSMTGHLPGAPTTGIPFLLGVVGATVSYDGPSPLVSRVGQAGVPATASVTYLGTFSKTVTLNCTDFSVSPACTVTPNSVTGSASLSLSVDAGTAPAGNYPLELIASDGTIADTAGVPYQIWDYSVIAPTSASAASGATTNIGFTLHPLNGAQNVDASCSVGNGLTGATCAILGGTNPISLAAGNVNLSVALTVPGTLTACSSNCTVTVHTTDHDVPATPARDATVSITIP